MKLSKKIIPHTSLRLNLMVACVTVLLLLLSLGVMLWFSRQALEGEARDDAVQTLESTEQHMDNILMTVEQTTYNIYQDIQGHLDQPDRMFTYCREVVETYPYIVGCARWTVYDGSDNTFSNYEYLGYSIPLKNGQGITPMVGAIHSWKMDQDIDIAAGFYYTIRNWSLYFWGNNFLKSHPRVVIGVDFVL